MRFLGFEGGTMDGMMGEAYKWLVANEAGLRSAAPEGTEPLGRYRRFGRTQRSSSCRIRLRARSACVEHSQRTARRLRCRIRIDRRTGSQRHPGEMDSLQAHQPHRQPISNGAARNAGLELRLEPEASLCAESGVGYDQGVSGRSRSSRSTTMSTRSL